MTKCRFLALSLLLCTVWGGFVVAVDSTQAASSGPVLFVSPPTGSFAIGSTFDVSVGLNTAGQTINAFKVRLLFQPDKLQVVSSGTGNSIAGFWIRRPAYSNEKGFVDFEGAIPSPGVNTDFGIITTLTFRVRSLGAATLRFEEESALYLNDGEGTQVGTSFQNGLYQLTLPPPLGPLVVSPTHPDQNKWYQGNDVVLHWTNDHPIGGYSYVLSQSPVGLPDNVSDGDQSDTMYRGLADGIHYFHIKALRNGVWGGVTHYGIKVQTSSPAKFPIDTAPGTRTSSKDIIFSFGTTDPLSGIEHYEAKVIPLNPGPDAAKRGEPFFFEVESPYVFHPETYGTYEFIVRAYNRAGNHVDSSVKVSYVKPFFEFIGSTGLRIPGLFAIPWYIVWPLALLVLLSLAYLAFHIFHWHIHIDLEHRTAAVSTQAHTEKLNDLRQRFTLTRGSLIIILLILSLAYAHTVSAVTSSQLPPPVTNLVSRNINNDEIFYIGGRAAAGSNGMVIVYLQSLSTGETFSFETPVSNGGDWFYTHPTFLQGGNYLLWTQLRIADQESPPSSQLQLVVSPKAIQLGASRLSYETIYLGLFLIFLLSVLGLSGFILYHRREGHRKYQSLTREVQEAQNAVVRGFALLRRDIRSELDLFRELKKIQTLTPEQEGRERRLLNDLEEINGHIQREVWDIEKALSGTLG